MQANSKARVNSVRCVPRTAPRAPVFLIALYAVTATTWSTACAPSSARSGSLSLLSTAPVVRRVPLGVSALRASQACTPTHRGNHHVKDRLALQETTAPWNRLPLLRQHAVRARPAHSPPPSELLLARRTRQHRAPGARVAHLALSKQTRHATRAHSESSRPLPISWHARTTLASCVRKVKVPLRRPQRPIRSVRCARMVRFPIPQTARPARTTR